MRIFDATLTTLERSLDVRLSRQAVLAADLANANTPGFVQRDLDFAAAMAAAPGTPEQFITEVDGGSPGLDGNAVDVDRASAALAQNALQYGAAAKAVARKLAILKYAASDGQSG